MTNVIYILHPCTVISKLDGDKHYIDAVTLARLYCVEWRKCRVMPTGDHLKEWKAPESAIHLYPKEDGDYTLPENKASK